MTSNQLVISPLIIAIDLGSSLFKVIHTGYTQRPEPLALRPQLVSAVSTDQIKAQMQEYGDDPMRSAWVEVDGQTYAAGEFAIDLAGRQYHELSKWEELLPRVLVILGLITQRLKLQNSFAAQVGLLLPRDEIYPSDREVRLAQIVQAAKQFQFRGQSVECRLDLKISTEGAGLFAAHAVALEKQGINPARVDIPVVMAGERNTSLVLYRGGKINPTRSSSDGPGFYHFADLLRKSLGATIALPDLIQAIAQGRDRIRTPGNQVISLAPFLPGVLEDYTNAIQAHLKAKIPQGDVYLIAGGGAFSLIWEPMQRWFQEFGIPSVYIGSLLEELTSMLATRPQDFDLIANPALPARFADALGMYKAMAARQSHHQSTSPTYR
jgi:hypothetical protein